jgi:YHS domain-containing protein
MSFIALTCLTGLLVSSARAEMTAEQKDAAAKLQAKGGLVIPVAANNDALIVSLSTVGKNAGDADLALVKILPKIEELNLRTTAITNNGLANIEGLTTLTHLHLESTGITDEGLSHLKGLSGLTYLNLYDTAVTDKGLAELSGLKNLKRLFLSQTKVTAAGAGALKKALPELYVNRGEELAITTQPAPAPEKKEDPKAVKKPDAKPEVKPDAKPAEKKPEDKKPEDKKPDDKTPADKKPEQASAKAINSKCPVSGEEVDAAHVIAFEGKNIGFCCEKCEAKFKADPKKFIDKVVADVK